MPGGRGPILVVEDDPDMRAAMCDALEDEGFAVAQARGVEAALRELRKERPGVIVLDWKMSPQGGSTFLAKISQDPELTKIPIVLATAANPEELGIPLQRFVATLRKPFPLEALIGILRRYF